MRLETPYEYVDEEGTLLYQNVRVEEAYKPKRFYHRRPIGNGRWACGLDGVRRVPYRLPQILAAKARDERIFGCEGEKDVATLEAWGLVATSTKDLAGFASLFRGAKFVLLYDADTTGRKIRDGAVAAIAPACADLRVVHLAPDDRNDGYDLTDWAAEGHSKEQLLDLVEAAPNRGNPASAILREIASLLREYVIMTSEDVDTISLWIAHAHAIDAFDVTPYLAIQSPTKECGKTLLTDVIEQLVPNPFSTAGSSVAVVFRTIASTHPTVLIDEIDAAAAGNKERFAEMLGLLNQGHRRGRPIGRCEGKDFKLRVFDVFCAKVLVGIQSLPDTLQSRCIVVYLRRKRRDERTRRFRMREIAERCKPLRERMAVWAKIHEDELRAARPEIPEEIDGRRADCWEPLIAIADLAGGVYPARARKLALETVAMADDQDLGIRLLADLREVLDEQTESEFAAAELIRLLCTLPETPWGTIDKRGGAITPHRFARLLRPFGIRSGQKNIGGENLRRYDRADFLDAFERYLPPTAAETATTATSLETPGFTELSKPLPDALNSSSENSAKPHDMGNVADVAFSSAPADLLEHRTASTELGGPTTAELERWNSDGYVIRRREE